MSISNKTRPDSDFTQIINGVKVTLGYDPHNYFNLSILGMQKAYHIDIRGFYDKSRPILDPLEWIKSNDGQKYMTKVCENSENVIFASQYQHTHKRPVTIFTRSFYIWLGYLKHCIGDIDTAINVEFNN